MGRRSKAARIEIVKPNNVVELFNQVLEIPSRLAVDIKNALWSIFVPKLFLGSESMTLAFWANTYPSTSVPHGSFGKHVDVC